MRVLRRSNSNAGFLVRWTFVLCSIAFVLLLQSPASSAKGNKDFQDVEDNDFAEFDVDEEFANAPNSQKKAKESRESSAVADEESVPAQDEEDEAIVESDEEDAHLQDDEEFEGYREGVVDEDDDMFDMDMDLKGRGAKEKKPPPPKTIKFTDVPAHLRNNWENYYLEILMAAGVVVYFINFFIGKAKNQRIANCWFSSHKALLESNFALVGDDGTKEVDDIETKLVKESESIFFLWCSGRMACDGMLVEMRMLKRQDLVSVISNIIKPSRDQIQVKVHMNDEDMDSFVFCLASKKAAAKLSKEMGDIGTFCPEKRLADKYGVSEKFVIMSEIAEVSAAMMDAKMTAVLNKYSDSVDSIHFSDQFTGVKPADDQVQTELPQGKKVLIFTFNILLKQSVPVEEAVEDTKPLMLLVFYFIDKIKRYKLSREAKNKAEKNRTKVSEAFWKSMHSARAEKAQEERERKKREIKERIKEIEDPELARKMEERELRKEKKRNMPKMKQMKIKAM